MGLVRVVQCVPQAQLHAFSLVLYYLVEIFSLDIFCVLKCFILDVPVLNFRNSDVATKKYR